MIDVSETASGKAPDLSPQNTPQSRRYELDWLRTLIVLGLIPFHIGGIFAAGSNLYLRNTQTSATLFAFGAFLSMWAMPLLFLVAGAGAWFALGRRTPRRYLAERFRRLMLPFIFVGLTLMPLQTFAVIQADPSLLQQVPLPLADSTALMSFPTFYIEYIRFYGYFLLHYSAQLEIVFWSSLWFIPRLFLYAVVTVPLFLALRGRRGARFIAWLGRACRAPGGIFLPGIALGVIDALIRWPSPSWQWTGIPQSDWASLTFNLVFFIAGYLIYADRALQNAVYRDGAAAFIVGVSLWALGLLGVGIAGSANVWWIGASRVISGASTWLLVIAVLSIGMRYLAFTNGALTYLNEAALPIYVLHMPVLLIVGSIVVGWDIGAVAKAAFLLLSVPVIILTLYEGIRRIPLLRTLFGMHGHLPKAAYESGMPLPVVP